MYIVIEGADGTGTTTQAKAVAKYLGDIGKTVFKTAEPTAGPIGSLIRDILRSPSATPSPKMMELLFRADRVNHMQRVIGPSLERGCCVVSDRSYFSTLVYQNIDDGSMERDKKVIVDMLRLKQDIMLLTDGVIAPDLTIVLDVSVDAAMGRVKRRGGGTDVFEEDAFQLGVRRYYSVFARSGLLAGETVLIDGSRDQETVTNHCIEVVKRNAVFKKMK